MQRRLTQQFNRRCKANLRDSMAEVDWSKVSTFLELFKEGTPMMLAIYPAETSLKDRLKDKFHAAIVPAVMGLYAEYGDPKDFETVKIELKDKYGFRDSNGKLRSVMSYSEEEWKDFYKSIDQWLMNEHQTTLKDI